MTRRRIASFNRFRKILATRPCVSTSSSGTSRAPRVSSRAVSSALRRSLLSAIATRRVTFSAATVRTLESISSL